MSAKFSYGLASVVAGGNLEYVSSLLSAYTIYFESCATQID